MLIVGKPPVRRCPASEVNDGLCPGKPDHLNDHQLIRGGLFDATLCPKSTLTNLDPNRMAWSHIQPGSVAYSD